VRFLFQFGEERLEGAKKAIEADVLEGVSGAFALHVATASPLPVGKYILAGTGEIAPYCDFFKTELQGKSAHGSTPELGTDALLAGAQFINALCQIPARETSPAKPAVLTAGTFRAGDAPNAIAQSAIIEGTLRAWDKNTQTRLLERVKTIASCIAKSCHAKAKFTRTGGCPALKNDPVLREKTARLIVDTFDKNALLSAEGQKGGGSEDFAFISQKVPSVFVAVSAGREEDGYIYPLHHPKTDFDENVLPYLSALFCAWALQKV
jgi:hippurate hydrolase